VTKAARLYTARDMVHTVERKKIIVSAKKPAKTTKQAIDTTKESSTLAITEHVIPTVTAVEHSKEQLMDTVTAVEHGKEQLMDSHCHGGTKGIRLHEND
jgi:DNA-binding transcriptional regulator YhcF (GntR family)